LYHPSYITNIAAFKHVIMDQGKCHSSVRWPTVIHEGIWIPQEYQCLAYVYVLPLLRRHYTLEIQLLWNFFTQ
jgi:hypothetical protein